LDYVFGFEIDNWFDHVIARHKELGPIFREQIVRGNRFFNNLQKFTKVVFL